MKWTFSLYDFLNWKNLNAIPLNFFLCFILCWVKYKFLTTICVTLILCVRATGFLAKYYIFQVLSLVLTHLIITHVYRSWTVRTIRSPFGVGSPTFIARKVSQSGLNPDLMMPCPGTIFLAGLPFTHLLIYSFKTHFWMPAIYQVLF